METLSKRSPLVVVEVALGVLGVLSLLLALFWIVGGNGLGFVGGDRTPDSFLAAQAVPTVDVRVRGEIGLSTAAAASKAMGPARDTSNGTVGADGSAYAEFIGNSAQVSFWTPTSLQRWAWVASHAAPAAGMAVIWLLLARIVRSVRRGEGFGKSTTRRILIVAALVGVGVPLVQVSQWLVARWLLATSAARNVAEIPPVKVAIWPVAVAVVLVVLAVAWLEGGRMRRELEGLV
jgi:hypothetical protein